ncbi:hypothetical protein ACLOJK_000711 [Asimina triloba]
MECVERHAYATYDKFIKLHGGVEGNELYTDGTLSRFHFFDGNLAPVENTVGNFGEVIMMGLFDIR